jgi:hypothetical protein
MIHEGGCHCGNLRFTLRLSCPLKKPGFGRVAVRYGLHSPIHGLCYYRIVHSRLQTSPIRRKHLAKRGGLAMSLARGKPRQGF